MSFANPHGGDELLGRVRGLRRSCRSPHGGGKYKAGDTLVVWKLFSLPMEGTSSRSTRQHDIGGTIFATLSGKITGGNTCLMLKGFPLPTPGMNGRFPTDIADHFSLPCTGDRRRRHCCGHG